MTVISILLLKWTLFQNKMNYKIASAHIATCYKLHCPVIVLTDKIFCPVLSYLEVSHFTTLAQLSVCSRKNSLNTLSLHNSLILAWDPEPLYEPRRLGVNCWLGPRMEARARTRMEDLMVPVSPGCYWSHVCPVTGAGMRL